jgi:hypothetical protein
VFFIYFYNFKYLLILKNDSSSGNDAFTADLLSREVLRATSLHPIKKSPYQYRLHNFLNMRKIIDLRQRRLSLQREMFKLKREILNIENASMSTSLNGSNKTSTPSTSTSAKSQSLEYTTAEYEIECLFESKILNKNENLSLGHLVNRFNLPPTLKSVKTPEKRQHRHDFDFFTRSLFSPTYISPKRGNRIAKLVRISNIN